MISGYIVSGHEKQLLFAEGLPSADITGCVVNTGTDEVDSAELKFPATNRAAKSLLHRNAVVELREDRETIFLGDVAAVTQRENGTMTLELDGALGWLRSIAKPPFLIHPTSQNGPIARFLTAIFAQYNAAAPIERVLQLGTVSASGGVEMDHSGEYTRMLDLFREAAEQLDGFFFADYSGGVPLIHFVNTPNATGLQTLELGRNVLTVERQLDFTDYASRVYSTGTYYVTSTVDGKEVRESVVLDAGSVTDSTAEAMYGRADLPYRSDTDMSGDKDNDIPDKTQAEAREIILTEARRYLNLHKTPLQTLTMTATELEQIGVRPARFRVGTMVRAVCAPIGIDAEMMVRKVKRDHINRANTVVTFGKAPRTLTRML